MLIRLIDIPPPLNRWLSGGIFATYAIKVHQLKRKFSQAHPFMVIAGKEN